MTSKKRCSMAEAIVRGKSSAVANASNSGRHSRGMTNRLLLSCLQRGAARRKCPCLFFAYLVDRPHPHYPGAWGTEDRANRRQTGNAPSPRNVFIRKRLNECLPSQRRPRLFDNSELGRLSPHATRKTEATSSTPQHTLLSYTVNHGSAKPQTPCMDSDSKGGRSPPVCRRFV